jgi:hypothetical protein
MREQIAQQIIDAKGKCAGLGLCTACIEAFNLNPPCVMAAQSFTYDDTIIFDPDTYRSLKLSICRDYIEYPATEESELEPDIEFLPGFFDEVHTKHIMKEIKMSYIARTIIITGLLTLGTLRAYTAADSFVQAANDWNTRVIESLKGGE